MKSMDRSAHYQIYLEGKIDERWLRWFEGLEVTSSLDNQTIIRGEFDQSALHGLFNRIRDLGVAVISVQRLPDRNESSHWKGTMNTKNFSLWFEILLTILIPILGMAMGVGAMFLFGLNQTDYGNLIVNLFFLIGVIALIRLFKHSSEDLGVKVINDQMKIHTTLSLAIFTLYMLFYLFVIRISTFKPFSSGTIWGLVTYLIVVFAEELYFRGALYSFFKNRYSARTALIVSSILFGLFHAQQGLRGVISRAFTGWLWGSVRYSTGMIFLLIIPVHFAYNSIWLLFEGNWNNPPTWVIIVLPAIEFVLGLAIILFTKRRNKSNG